MTRPAPISRSAECSLCERPQYALDLCYAHYQRWRRQRKIELGRPIERRLPKFVPPTCVCDIDPVKVRCIGFGAVVCTRCGKPPIESFGIFWTETMVEDHRRNPRIPERSNA